MLSVISGQRISTLEIFVEFLSILYYKLRFTDKLLGEWTIMRFDIAKSGTGVAYEIRNIVNIAEKLKEYGVQVTWENIGDPVEKGEKIPGWMKETLTEIINDDISYAYSPTKGIEKTREFLAEENSPWHCCCYNRYFHCCLFTVDCPLICWENRP